MAPLYDVLKGKTRKRDKSPITWTSDLTEAFEQVKQAFINYTLLHFIDDNYPLQLTCDARGVAVGGVLEQIIDNEPRPIAFYSEKLKGNQLSWIPYDKELYALYACVSNLDYLIKAFDLTLVTDHKPLLPMFLTKKRITLERRSRYIEFISQYTTKIKHISGQSNIVADAISRTEIGAIQILSLQDIPYEGPFEVVKRGKKFFKLRFPKGDDYVSIDRLKPAHELATEEMLENNSGPTSILKKVNFNTNIEVTNNNINNSSNLVTTRSYRQPQAMVSFQPEPSSTTPLPQPIIQPQTSARNYTTMKGRIVKPPVRYNL